MAIANAIAQFGMNAGNQIQNTVHNALARNENNRRYQNALAMKQQEVDAAKAQQAAEQERAFFASVAQGADQLRQSGRTNDLPAYWAAAGQAGAQRGFDMADWPEYSEENLVRLMGAVGVEMPKASAASSPSAVREHQYFNSLTPEQQDVYLRVKRADPRMNLGGTVGTLNQATGGLGSEFTVTPKESETPAFKARVAGDTVLAKSRAEEEAAAPAKREQAMFMLQTINDLIKHPGREAATGRSSVMNFAAPLIGGDRVDYLTQLDQLKGQSFLQAYNSLRGGGQITEVEGRKAEQAIARLNTAQSEEGFLKALEDLRSVVISAINKFDGAGTRLADPAAPKQQAGGTKEGQTATNPQTGERIIFRGGKWQKL